MRESRAEGKERGTGAQLTYMPALDGIRAVSIMGIMLNHGGFGWAAGGLISVNVFFVLSGFLITLLLMREWAKSGTIRLRNFWARRARRLLPALFVLLAGIAVYAWLLAPDGTQGSLRVDGLTTLLYVANWHQIFSGQSYFAQVATTSPLLHTWTLAIEEQFYLVWPLVVLAVLKWRKSPRLLLGITIFGIAASAIEMALLFHPGLDPSRLYYGTDTRAQDILVGAAVALLIGGRRQGVGLGDFARGIAGDAGTIAGDAGTIEAVSAADGIDSQEGQGVDARRTRRRTIGYSLAIVVAAAVFGFEWSRITDSSSLPYRGGFLLADLMVGVVIVGVVRAPTGLPARLLAIRPLTYVGRISYGLYLWHWPVILVLDNARTGLEGWSLFLLRAAVSFIIAVLSWHFVEVPIRQRKFTTWRTRAWLPVSVVGIVGVLVVATAGGIGAGGAAAGAAATQAEWGAVHVTTFTGPASNTRVLFVGDSLSLTVAIGIAPEAAQYGITIGGRTHVGCGIAVALPLNDHGTIGDPFPNCPTWPSWWAQDVNQLHPQVVALVMGWWETMDRMYQGRWQHLGDPAFDAYETAQLEKAVSILASTGSRVALMTAPYFDSGEQPNGLPWDEDSPARVNRLNSIIESVAARHRGSVWVVPLNQYLDPNGHFTWTIDGKVVRQPDGIHTTVDGGAYLAPKVLPALAAIASAPR
ncbi:MAG TPA: acyltransferase family protein [Acidimicrobiales bacterium]|nr:acyltransferase family protein [Acidimicrobiales bacterium]